MTEPVARLAGRALLIDPGGRVLLVHEQFEGGEPHWITPGGGVEPGERPSGAAVREVYEETGIAIGIDPDAEPVLVEHDLWSIPPPAPVTYDQENHFFAAAVPAGLAARPHALTELELKIHLGYRWWAPAELRATGETVYPAGLADLLELVTSRLRPGG